MTVKEQRELKALEELLARVSKPGYQDEHGSANDSEDYDPGASFTRPGYID